ncbi:uncharacterized protein ACA1_384810 [Acanthamoeba castellanii str. Neff]|uniref:Uncharacterized protein n=1 Tax=Acanthamoeba castellanii (strain ATCC 30010 / Neff) TaxID=1257118 RepID=L8H990_ACACF|nr:uncharacterized protein ACA1_384810 [Acanthamoeba castellanii str. Neff]ELR21745.1 hypothetical protein ACA1_384810 [Acanthamoeba castellanii str. Neff]
MKKKKEEQEQGKKWGRKCLRLEEPDPPASPEVVHLEPPYKDFFHWGQRLIDTGAGGNYCDEPVGEELVAEAQDLLRDRFDALVPRWYEDDGVTLQRRSEIERGFEVSWGKYEAKRVLDKADNKVRVFNSALPPSDARFEITYVDFDDSSIEYGFLVDRQTREFVFAGVFGGHPHCGTANFSYDNSDGSGPSLFPSDFYEQGQNGEEEEEENKEEVEVDPENVIETSTQAAKELIAAVKKRISEFCLNRYH